MHIFRIKRLSLLVLSFLATMPTLASAESVKVFLMGGSSNMWGHGFASEVPPPLDAPQDDVWIWQDDKGDNVGWTELRPGFGNTDSNLGSAGDHNRCNSRLAERGHCVDKVGSELTLGRTLADAFPNNQIALVKHTHGGRNLHTHWNPDNVGPPDPDHMYSGLSEKIEDATQFLRDAGLSYEIAGMFLYMGGGEGRDADFARDFESNLENLVASVREDFAGDPSMPFVIGRQHSHLPLADFPFINTIRAAQDNVAASDPWTATVNTDDVSRRPFNEMYLGDSLHFDTAGQLELGRRYANTYLELLMPSSSGDYNGDGFVNVVDIDLQSVAMGETTPDLSTFDENRDGVVDVADRTILLHEHANTYFGDANLDGEFNSSDFVFVFQAGEYEDGIAENSSWETGDWNGDREFNTSDFVLAFQGGGFEQGPRDSVATVPEPNGAVLGISSLLLLVLRYRRR